MWTPIDFNPNITLLHQISNGVPVWIKIKAVNNGRYYNWARLPFHYMKRCCKYIMVSVTSLHSSHLHNDRLNNRCDVSPSHFVLVSLTVDLRTIGISDSPIIVDQSPPVAGQVYDGQTAGIDMAYMKDNNKVVRQINKIMRQINKVTNRQQDTQTKIVRQKTR
jgi:hypothetical protein